MANDLKSPLLVHLEVTYECNKRCMHCYNFWRDCTSKIKNEALINEEALNNSINQIIENEVFHVVITGGEPLLVLDQIYPYLLKLKKHNISMSMNTNMMMFNEDVAKKLKILGINNLLVSFPAHTKELDTKITNNPYSFERTYNAIKFASKEGFIITCNMVVTKINYPYIKETAILAKKAGARKFSVNMAVPPDNCNDFSKYLLSKDEFVSLPSVLKKIHDEIGIKVESVEAYPHCFIDDEKLLEESGFNRGCSAGKTFCVISPDGQIRPCIIISENYGNNLKQAWKDMIAYRDGSLLPYKCKTCKKVNKCNGGCKAQAKYKNLGYDPYMNEENADKFINNKVDNKIIEFSAQDLFRLNDNVRYRNEEFGGTFISSTSSYVPVDSALYQFLLSNETCNFNYLDFINGNDYRFEEGHLTLNYLIAKKIIKQLRNLI